MEIASKYIILLFGLRCTSSLFVNNNLNATRLGIAAAGCLIVYDALIENNDVKKAF